MPVSTPSNQFPRQIPAQFTAKGWEFGLEKSFPHVIANNNQPRVLGPALLIGPASSYNQALNECFLARTLRSELWMSLLWQTRELVSNYIPTTDSVVHAISINRTSILAIRESIDILLTLIMYMTVIQFHPQHATSCIAIEDRFGAIWKIYEKVKI